MGMEQKAEFIHRLAEFMVKDQAKRSIQLEMGSGWPSWEIAETWRDLRNATPIRGWPTVEEAEKELTEFLR